MTESHPGSNIEPERTQHRPCANRRHRNLSETTGRRLANDQLRNLARSRRSPYKRLLAPKTSSFQAVKANSEKSMVLSPVYGSRPTRNDSPTQHLEGPLYRELLKDNLRPPHSGR